LIIDHPEFSWKVNVDSDTGLLAYNISIPSNPVITSSLIYTQTKLYNFFDWIDIKPVPCVFQAIPPVTYPSITLIKVGSVTFNDNSDLDVYIDYSKNSGGLFWFYDNYSLPVGVSSNTYDTGDGPSPIQSFIPKTPPLSTFYVPPVCFPLPVPTSVQKLTPDVSAPVFPSTFTLLGIIQGPVILAIYLDASKGSVRVDTNSTTALQINSDVYHFNREFSFIKPYPCQTYKISGQPIFSLPKLLNEVINATVNGKNATVWSSSTNEYWYMGMDGVPLIMISEGVIIQVTSFTTEISDHAFDVPDPCVVPYQKKEVTREKPIYHDFWKPFNLMSSIFQK